LGGLYRETKFSSVAPGQGLGVQRGGGPTKSLNGFSQGGGVVCNPLESGHQGGGIGVLEMSVLTTLATFFDERHYVRIVPYVPVVIRLLGA
jgi:hypothetical protein